MGEEHLHIYVYPVIIIIKIVTSFFSSSFGRHSLDQYCTCLPPSWPAAQHMASPRDEPGPTPDSRPREGEAGGTAGEGSSATSASAATRGGEKNWWFANLWEQTQQNTQTTIRYFEQEHKKNVQKFEAAFDEIKTATEEVADGIQSQLEGRKSLKALREERVRTRTVHASLLRSKIPRRRFFHLFFLLPAPPNR